MSVKKEQLSSLVWAIITFIVLIYNSIILLLCLVKIRTTGLWTKLLIAIELTLIAELIRLIARHQYYVIRGAGEF